MWHFQTSVELSESLLYLQNKNNKTNHNASNFGKTDAFECCTVHSIFKMKSVTNKKVLLRERNKHTDRGVSSTASVTRGGVPTQQGNPPPRPARSDWGVPKVGYLLAGVSPTRSDRGGVPEVGYTPVGVPPPPRQV